MNSENYPPAHNRHSGQLIGLASGLQDYSLTDILHLRPSPNNVGIGVILTLMRYNPQIRMHYNGQINFYLYNYFCNFVKYIILHIFHDALKQRFKKQLKNINDFYSISQIIKFKMGYARCGGRTHYHLKHNGHVLCHNHCAACHTYFQLDYEVYIT